MSRPLPLSAYLALRRGATPQDGQSDAARPARLPGMLVWMHVPDGPAAASAEIVAEALGDQHPDITLLLTGPGAQADDGKGRLMLRGRVPVINVRLPDDSVAEARAFINHWRPDALVWVGADLRPGLLDATRGLPMTRVLVTPGLGPYVSTGRFLLPGVVRSLLSLFQAAFCQSKAEIERLQKSGFGVGDMQVRGRFETLAPVLPVVESDHDDMMNLLGTRPLSLATPAHADELDQVVSSHRAAARLAHRLLLILASPDPAVIRRHAALDGLKVADRTHGEDPTDLTDVLLTDADEPGLWYRLAPVCVAGGTLSGQAVTDPYAAAALGSVVIHGLQTGPWSAAFDRLDAAGAAVAIDSGQALTRRVEEFLAVDRSAEVAHAAWDVVTAGAETTNAVADYLTQALAARAGA